MYTHVVEGMSTIFDVGMIVANVFNLVLITQKSWKLKATFCLISFRNGKRHLSWVKCQIVSPYLIIDALDSQNSNGHEVCAHLKTLKDSLLGSFGIYEDREACAFVKLKHGSIIQRYKTGQNFQSLSQ